MTNFLLKDAIRLSPFKELVSEGFTDQEMKEIWYKLIGDPREENLIMETASIKDIDAYYNPGEFEGVFEAVTIRKFSEMGKKMTILQRVLNRALKEYNSDKEDADRIIVCLDPIVGPAKKNGLFSTATVQFPFSDGQVISVVFHSPYDDRKKITADDTVLSFRWLLNKRDITHAVSPEQGKEISFQTIGKRVTQILAKNSKQFQERQVKLKALKEEFETANQELITSEEKHDELINKLGKVEEEQKIVDFELENTRIKVKNLKEENTKLQTEIAELKNNASHDELEIEDAKKLLASLKEQLKAQGDVVDDRLLNKIKQTEALIKELETKPDSGVADPEPLYEVGFKWNSSDGEREIKEIERRSEGFVYYVNTDNEVDDSDEEIPEKDLPSRIEKDEAEFLKNGERNLIRDNIEFLNQVINGDFDNADPEDTLRKIENVVFDFSKNDVDERHLVEKAIERIQPKTDPNAHLIGKKAKILKEDALGRWEVGEIGTIVENTFHEKYDFMIDLGPVAVEPDTEGVLKGVKEMERVYYFDANEIELIDKNAKISVDSQIVPEEDILESKVNSEKAEKILNDILQGKYDETNIVDIIEKIMDDLEESGELENFGEELLHTALDYNTGLLEKKASQVK